MIAKSVYLVPAVDSGGLSASDIVAICSLIVAVLALGFSIAAAETQRRHNIRMARPHMDIDRGLQSFLLRITNQGPGIARLQSLTAYAGTREFNLLVESGVDEFCTWIAKDMQRGGIKMERNLLSAGTSFAPNLAIELVVLASDLNDNDKALLEEKLKRTSFRVSYKSIFDRLYSDDIEPIL